MQKYKILRDAVAQLDDIFVGLAIPCQKSTADGGTVASEKVLKFQRTKKAKAEAAKATPTTGDHSVVREGSPGSRERIEAYARHYASTVELSPFSLPSGD
jgi:hypothetical protein